MNLRAAQVRIYVDADLLGLGKILADLRNDAMPLTAITTGLGTGSRQTPNGSKRCEPHSTCGPFPATAGSDPSTLACLRDAQQR
jgi:hypothetical protein